MGDLDQITIGEEFTLHTAERQKSVDQSLGAAHGYRRGKQHVRLEQSYAGQYDGKRFGSIHRHAPILQSKSKPVDISTLSVHESELASRAVSFRRTGLCNGRERAGVVLSFRLVRFAENSRLDVLGFSVVRLLISVAICFAIGLFVLVQVTFAIRVATIGLLVLLGGV